MEDARAGFRRLVRREASGVRRNWWTTNESRRCTRKVALCLPRFSPVGGGGASVLAVVAACGSSGPAAPALTDPVDILVQSIQTLDDVKSFRADVAVSGTVNVDAMGTGTAQAFPLDNTTAQLDVDVANKNAKASFSAPALMGISGELINPRFTWEPAANTKRYPVKKDAVELWRVEGDQRIPLLRVTPERFQALTSAAWRYVRERGSGTTSGMASIHGSSIQLVGGFYPGVYEWQVQRNGHDSPPPRRFTVAARPMKKAIRTRVATVAASSSLRAGAARRTTSGD